MFRRKSIISDSSCSSDDLAPHDSYEMREQRWVSFIDRIDAGFEKSISADAKSMNIVQYGRNRAAAAAPSSHMSIVDEYFSVLSAPGTGGFRPITHTSMVGTRFMVSRKGLKEWIQLEKSKSLGEVDGPGASACGGKKYFERAVGLLNSLVQKVVITDIKDGKAELEVAVDPKFITSDNLVVQQAVNEGETLDFVKCGAEDTASLAGQKYAAMKALGSVAYELLMRGSGPPIQAFLPSTATSSDGTARLLLCLDDYDEKTDDRERAKRQRAAAADANKQARISAAMISAGVPYPLCRFVVDLLGGECSDGLLFRSDSSFESFSDILQDLEQMIANPEAFIHLSIKDQWRLAFGEKMHGRDKEQKMLLDAAARVTGTNSNDALLEALAMLTPQGKQQIVMVTGSAGSGKSRLVMETKKSLENRGWLFLHCKFDRIVHSEPLSIIAGAFDEFLEECIGTLRQHQIRTKLKAMMQPTDVSILSKHVPCLAKFLDGPLDDMGRFEANKDQIHHLFCKLIAALSAPGQAAALFCDDLQWADTTSLDLFAALTKASESDLSSSSSSGIPSKKTKLLFIGAYRDNEVYDNARLVELLNSLKSTSTVQVTEIGVRGFDIGAMNMIVSKSLCLPLRRTKPLSEIILQKTDGIVIHIIEFMGRLTAERILCHSFVKGWEWDSETIESCPISDSVAELFTHKLKSLSAADVLGLQICSIFGIRIEQRTISLLNGYDGDDSVDIGAALKAAIEVGLVEIHDSLTMFRFAHDIIAQTVFDLIPREERKQLLKKLVSVLIRNATAAGEIDENVFVVVDLINRIPKEEVLDPTQRVLFATMNEKAGKKALSVPDFCSAFKYSESSLSFLNSNHWKSHHNLMLSIHETSVIALYSFTNGNQDLLTKRINTVFEYASNLDEEFRTRLVWIKHVSTTSLQAAINECHTLLDRMGEPIDPSDVDVAHVASELLRVKGAIQEGSRQLSFQMTDVNKIMALKVMVCLIYSYFHQRSYNIVIVILRMVEISLKFGCCEESFFALASFSSNLIVFLGDIDQGVCLSRMTLALMSKSRQHNINAIMPAVITAVYGFALWLVEPIQSTMDQLLHGGIRLAFDYGNVSFAMNNVKTYIGRIGYCGKNINAALSELEVLAKKSALHGQISVVEHYLVPINNILRKLRGLDEQVLAPIDAFVNNSDLLQKLLTNNAVQVNLEFLLLLEITVSFIFRDMDKAQRIAELIQEKMTKKSLVFNYIMTDFYIGLLACYSSRHAQDTNPLPQVEMICDKFKWLASHSRWNFESKLNLLTAECQYAHGEIDKAAASYDCAIKSAKEHKFDNEVALACELAGYFYKEQGEESKAVAMFKQSRDAYIKWGAVGKAQTLPFLEKQCRTE